MPGACSLGSLGFCTKVSVLHFQVLVRSLDSLRRRPVVFHFKSRRLESWNSIFPFASLRAAECLKTTPTQSGVLYQSDHSVWTTKSESQVGVLKDRFGSKKERRRGCLVRICLPFKVRRKLMSLVVGHLSHLSLFPFLPSLRF